MKDEEWAITDLVGELMSHGVSINDIPFIEIYKQLNCASAKEAGKNIIEREQKLMI